MHADGAASLSDDDAVGDDRVGDVVGGDAGAAEGATVGPDGADADVLRAAHEARLQQVGRMLAGIVHEIRNPLTVIQGCGQLLEASVEDDAALEDVRNLLDATRRLSRLVDDMLGFVRRDGAESVGSVDLGQVLESTLRLTTHAMRQARVSVVVNAPDTHPPVRGQAAAYTQVFLNLLDNARASLEDVAAADRGVSVRVEPGDTCTVVRVSNNGPPIAPEHAPRLFESFFTTKGAGRGTGLGLPLCREILARFGGEIALESPGGAGEAVTFRLELPNA